MAIQKSMPAATGLVVFHNHGNHWLDPWLKRGFRHCFCAIEDDKGYWIIIDGRAGVPVVEVVAGDGFDLKGFYEDLGYQVLVVRRGVTPGTSFVLTNCVGMVKAVLGLRAFGAVTPYQLYRRLQ